MKKIERKKPKGPNKVGQAIARAKLAKAILSFKLMLYTREAGSTTHDWLDGAVLMMATLAAAAEADPNIGFDDVGVRVMRGGLSACSSALMANKWDPILAVAVERALEEAEAINNRVGFTYVMQAHAASNIILKEVLDHAAANANR